MNLTKRVKHVWADIVCTRRKKTTTTHTHIQKGKNNQKAQTNKTSKQTKNPKTKPPKNKTNPKRPHFTGHLETFLSINFLKL